MFTAMTISILKNMRSYYTKEIFSLHVYLDLKITIYNMFLGRRHPTEQHEILDGIVAKPGGDYIHSVYRHRRVLQQSRQVFHGQKMYFLFLISQNPGCIEIQVRIALQILY